MRLYKTESCGKFLFGETQIETSKFLAFVFPDSGYIQKPETQTLKSKFLKEFGIQHFNLYEEDLMIALQFHVFSLTELVEGHLHVRQVISQFMTFFESVEEGTNKNQ